MDLLLRAPQPLVLHALAKLARGPEGADIARSFPCLPRRGEIPPAQPSAMFPTKSFLKAEPGAV